MRSRWLVSTALAAAAALWARPATAFEWAGRLGAGYAQSDEWTPGVRRTTPTLDLNLGLDLGGSVFRPGILDYSGSFDARRVTENRSDAPEVERDYLRYSGRLTLFGNPNAPVSLSAFATRNDDRFSVSGTSGGNFSGISRLFGADARYRQAGRPTLTLGYSRLDTESTSALIKDERTVHTYTASTSMGTQGFSYGASYAGLLSEGVHPSDAFHDHRVDAFAAGNVSDTTEARIAEAYYLRTPDATSPFAPRQELNSLQAYITNRIDTRDLQRGTYSYSHGLQTVPGLDEVERTVHRGGYSVQRTLTPEWRLATAVDATYAENRLADVTRRDGGQSLALTGSWTRQLQAGTFHISAGPSVGAVEPDGERTRFGWGATATSNLTHRAGVSDYQAGYTISFSDDSGQPGTSFSQTASGSAQTPVGEGTFVSQLTFSSQRRYGTPFGAGALRILGGTGSYLWRAYALSATVSLTSGLSNAVTDPGGGDGLFLGLPYDQHTLTTTLQGTAQLSRHLAMSLSGRFTARDYADRPAADESEARASVVYGIGALTLAFDERYIITHSAGLTQRSNVVFVSVGRAFGSRY